MQTVQDFAHVLPCPAGLRLGDSDQEERQAAERDVAPDATRGTSMILCFVVDQVEAILSLNLLPPHE